MSPATFLRAGGCIRFGADGPYWHENDVHVTIGVLKDTLRIEGKDLCFELDPAHHAPVVGMGTWPDETLASRGIIAGPSGGTRHMRITMHRAGSRLDLSNPTDYAHIQGDYSNLWFAVHSLAPVAEPEPDPEPPVDPCEPGLTIGDLDAAWKALSPNALQAIVTVGTLLSGSGCGCTCRTT